MNPPLTRIIIRILLLFLVIIIVGTRIHKRMDLLHMGALPTRRQVREKVIAFLSTLMEADRHPIGLAVAGINHHH